MDSVASIKNWVVGTNSEILNGIHEREVNITIFNRDIILLREELNQLVKSHFEFRSSGNIDDISEEVASATSLTDYPLFKQDFLELLGLFNRVAKADSYRLFLATIENNMCRKFHTDVNDLRMLCTYKGPGTLWLPEDNVNPNAGDDDSSLVIDENRICQADTGAVVILKGATYPKEGTSPIIHRSPSIEESNEKRILLRIDTDEFANF